MLYEILDLLNIGKPICSRYISFNVRDIIYQYPFDIRIVRRMCFPNYSKKRFPIETSHFVTQKEFNKILKYGIKLNDN